MNGPARRERSGCIGLNYWVFGHTQQSAAANCPKNLNNSKREPLKCSEEQHRRLRNLLGRSKDWIGAPRGTRLRILTLSCEQRTAVEIANELGSVGRNRVYQILDEAETRGLEAEIADLEAFAVKRDLSSAKSTSHAGRRGYETWEQYTGGEFFEGEVYIEVATLIMAPGIRLAALIVSRTTDINSDRPGKTNRGLGSQTKQVLPVIYKEVHEILEKASSSEVISPAWTRISTFDSTCEELFVTLRHKEQAMELIAIDICFLEGEDYDNIADLFPGVERCLIFAAGESNFCDSVVSAIADGVACDLIRVEDEDEFLDRLESAVFTLRNRVTGIGLLPSFWQLNNDITPDADDDLIWQGNHIMAVNWMVRRLAVRDFFALRNALFEPSRSLLAMLPYRGVLKFKTLALKPKIEVIEHRPEQRRLMVQVRPIPELEYLVELRCARDPKKMVQGIRELLRSTQGERVRRIQYSAEHPDNELGSSVPPSLEQILAPFNAVGSSGASVVLIQRHFLCPKPGIYVDRAKDTLQSSEDGVWVMEIDEKQQGNRILVAKFGCFHDALRKAFEANRYCDSIAAIGQWQGSLLNYSAMRPAPTKIDWLANCQPMNAYNNTTYCYFPKDAPHGTGNIDLGRQMNYAVSQLSSLAAESGSVTHDLTERFKKMVSKINGAHARSDAESAARALSEFQVDAAQILSGSIEVAEDSVLGFPYDSEATFLRLLLDLDADFLIRHLTANDRAHLENIAGHWRDLSVKLIEQAFWPAGQFQRGRALSLCSEDLGRKLQGVDLELLCREALSKFASGRMRVPRWAIETGQRMLIDGELPIFFAVQSEDDLLRSWRSFLGQRMRRVLDAEDEPKMESLDAMHERQRDRTPSSQASYDEEPEEDSDVDRSNGLGWL